jgi:ribosomal protein S18 acetylase RimI-like enzyme
LPDPPLTRSARAEDAEAVAAALYLSSPEGFRLFGGGERGGLRLIAKAFATAGNDCSCDVVTVAELEGEVAGAMASFPAREGAERRRRFVRVALRQRPPWQWARLLLMSRAGASHAPTPPADAFYVDSLGTGARFRRRGVARTLLEAAERSARERGLSSLALDTRATNTAARALYEGFGFELTEEVPAARSIPALVGYVKKLG